MVVQVVHCKTVNDALTGVVQGTVCTVAGSASAWRGLLLLQIPLWRLWGGHSVWSVQKRARRPEVGGPVREQL